MGVGCLWRGHLTILENGMMSKSQLYTNPRAVKARDSLGTNTPVKTLTTSQSMLKALTMTTVVCNPESPGGWKDANTKCMGCGREVYCNPLFESADVKLCVRCAGVNGL